MGVLGAVVSLEGGVASGAAEWCSERCSASMSCRLFRAYLMRWDTYRDPSANQNPTTTVTLEMREKYKAKPPHMPIGNRAPDCTYKRVIRWEDISFMLLNSSQLHPPSGNPTYVSFTQ